MIEKLDVGMQSFSRLIIQLPEEKLLTFPEQELPEAWEVPFLLF